jgi:hypothetical protein
MLRRLADSTLFHKVKEKIISSTSLTLSRKTALTFILVFTVVIVFDTTIVSFSSYSGVELPTWLNVMTFVIFSIIFAIGSTILLNSVRKIVSKYSYKPTPRSWVFSRYNCRYTILDRYHHINNYFPNAVSK